MGVGDEAGDGVAVGDEAGDGVAVGIDVGDAEGEREVTGCLTGLPSLQTNFFPDLTHVYFLP